MPKSWEEKARSAKPAHVVVLEKLFAGIPVGARLLIPSPPVIEAFLKTVPAGETRSLPDLRDALAARNGADATCPVTASIHLRIVAEVAIGRMNAGAAASQVAPFWRVVGPGDKVAAKLPIDGDALRTLRRLDAVAREAPATPA